MNQNFELKILATNWGFHGTIDEYLSQVKKEGYDGIEIWWPFAAVSQAKKLEKINKMNYSPA